MVNAPIVRWLAVVVVAAALLVAVLPGHATTYREVEVTCPLCQQKFTASAMMSTFISGYHFDLREKFNHWGFMVYVYECPKCGFAAWSDRFEKLEGLDKTKVRQAVDTVHSASRFRTVDTAIAVERVWGNDPTSIASLALRAKYLADDTGEPQVIRDRLRQAVVTHTAALEAATKKPSKAYYCYLVGEFHFELGEFNEAIPWFDRALEHEPEGPIREFAERRRFAARYRGKPVKDVLAAAAKGSDAEKLAAIPFLRDSHDGEVVALLESFILNCPEGMQREACGALAAGGYRRHHLGLYRKVLDSGKKDLIWLGCGGAARFGDASAIPAILKTLEKPPEYTSDNLLEALAALAHEPEHFAVLEQRVRKDDSLGSIFNGLVENAHAAALPLLGETLKRDHYAASYGRPEREGLEAMSRRGPALVALMPDIGTADAADEMAALKVRLLGVLKTDEARATLKAALARDDRIGFAVALELARLGDHAGKPILMKHLDWLMDGRSELLRHVYPMLDRSDFAAVHAAMSAAMATAKEEEKQHLERRRGLRERLLKRKEGKDAEDDPLVDRLFPPGESLQFDEEAFERGFTAGWLGLLAATGHPDARALLMTYVNDSRDWLSSDSSDAADLLYDDEIAGHLARYLRPGAAEWDQCAAMRIMARHRDARYVDRILALVAEPTAVHFKVAWIEAMKVLAPDRGRPYFERWAESPKARLAEAARETLKATETN